MQLWVAILLFLLSVAGAVLSARKLRHNKPLRVVCIALCAVIAAACAVYIVLTVIMLYAASTPCSSALPAQETAHQLDALMGFCSAIFLAEVTPFYFFSTARPIR